MTHPVEATPPVPSNRSKKVKPFLVMEVIARANKLQSDPTRPSDKSILHLEIGQPTAAPPQPILEAASAALAAPLGYTATLGLPTLRTAIAHRYERLTGRTTEIVSPEDVVVATGASAAFVALFTAAFDPDDRVAVSTPGYPCYRHILSALAVRTVTIPTTRETNFQPTPAQLRALHSNARPLAGLILASPSNPTGSVLSVDELTALAAVCSSNSITLIVDEVYHGISKTPVPSAIAHCPHAIVVASFSKFWAMTGFRVGWLVIRNNRPLLNAVSACLQSMCISPPTIAQHAALPAANGQCDAAAEQLVNAYFAAAEILVPYLVAAGFDAVVPAGAFYLYVGCENVCQLLHLESSVELCTVLLEECGVACTPGVDFDEDCGGQFVRFSFAVSTDLAEMAGKRILDFVKSHQGER